ncbi:MAG: TonB-dependent receptor [Pedosphaera sp.]|nr:TonB-dependent receptor [Pedosphaera sp.]
MSERVVISTNQKAVEINLDDSKYGTFAEIGAGQEVARWFFRVGGASGTIAKAMSAYDMKFSDAIYGPCERYVSRPRVESMLSHEYGLLIERLAATRGSQTKFFVFADTVAARGHSQRDDAHGWMGIRFQSEPLQPPSQILMHVRLSDRDAVQEQEALGVLGVNLVHGAMYLFSDPEQLIASLVDNLTTSRVEVDMIQFSGPAFERVDNRLMSLKLVQSGLSNAVMFTSDGQVVQPADVLYKKSILVERGSFRPITNVTIDMLECGQGQFVQEPKVQGEEVVVLMEMTMKNLTTEGGIDHKDFLARVDVLGTLGKTVLISNYGEYFRLAAHLFRYTKKMVGFVMGVPSLREIFEEKYYTSLDGGILESFGRLFKNDLKLYVYPLREQRNGALITAQNLQVATNLTHLYAHLLENRFIAPLRGYNPDCLPIYSRDVQAKIQSGTPGWEKQVPPQVAAIIKQRRLFGFAG